MSMFGLFTSEPTPGVPTMPEGETVAAYRKYVDAQRAVDYLSDQQFPVQCVSIVGSDLKHVERVTGRLTYGRVAFRGLLQGSWLGFIIGMILSYVEKQTVDVSMLPPAMMLGAALGILTMVVVYMFSGGRRDFTSTLQLVAGHYEVLCHDHHAAEARNLLTKASIGGQFLAPASWAPPGSGPAQQGVPTETSEQSAVESVPAQPDLSGPTYGEMMDKKRAERRAAEAAAQAKNAAD